ncbi:hypothetical protein [Streptomyces hundungensis]|uniref:hypothetical protein n=1 Tax=Streptomyces hundungensis TaxID=1077946 RepID=UPI0033CB1F5A
MALALGWLIWLLRELKRLCRLAGRDRGRPADGRVPSWAYRRPDPLIYSQQYLQGQGFAVTWDNPDIHVQLASAPGVFVDAHALTPDTEYQVVARIWNGSTTAPAPGLPVRVGYLAFGAGTTWHEVGTTKVDVPVKGAVGCPATATVPWRTPVAPGHYCLQVELLWDDDANPDNNLGQSNTDVKPLNSPHAAFTFPVRNDRAERALVTLWCDGYAIPPLESCEASEGEDTRRMRMDRHRAEHWPVPDGWRVEVNPDRLALAPGEQADISVDITAPDGFTGRQAINVNAAIGDGLLGGVTLYVDGTG